MLLITNGDKNILQFYGYVWCELLFFPFFLTFNFAFLYTKISIHHVFLIFEI